MTGSQTHDVQCPNRYATKPPIIATLLSTRKRPKKGKNDRGSIGCAGVVVVVVIPVIVPVIDVLMCCRRRHCSMIAHWSWVPRCCCCCLLRLLRMYRSRHLPSVGRRRLLPCCLSWQRWRRYWRLLEWSNLHTTAWTEKHDTAYHDYTTNVNVC